MRPGRHIVKARVWLYPGKAGWHFLTIERVDAEEIKKDDFGLRRGFGSIPVSVKIGKSEWRTSIFPEKRGSYLLPLKKSVREAEGVKEGDVVRIEVGVRGL